MGSERMPFLPESMYYRAKRSQHSIVAEWVVSRDFTQETGVCILQQGLDLKFD